MLSEQNLIVFNFSSSKNFFIKYGSNNFGFPLILIDKLSGSVFYFFSLNMKIEIIILYVRIC